MEKRSIIGDRFGRLVVINELPGGKAVCQCDCGKIHYVLRYNLLSGGTKSCGCLKSERAIMRDRMRYAQLEEGQRTNLAMLVCNHPVRGNPTGVKGVCKVRGKYRAYITYNRERHDLGLFKRLEDAVKARKDAEAAYYADILQRIKDREIWV